MTVEDILVGDLRSVAAGLQVPPPPDPAELRRLAERDTWRRRARTGVLTGVAVAAAVTAVLIGVRLDRPDAAPPITPSPSPSYYAAGVPYLQDNKLYIAHQQQPGSWISLTQAGPFTAVTSYDLQRVLLLRNGAPVTTTDSVHSGVAGLVLSAGGTIAWVEETGGNGVVVSLNLITGKEIGRVDTGLPVSSSDGANNFQLGEVRDDGTVYYLAGAAPDGSPGWIWRPGSAPRPHEQVATEFEPPAGFPADVSVRLSPDGLWGAWYVDDTTIAVQKPGVPSSRYTVELSRPVPSPHFLSWDSPTVVQLVAEDRLLNFCDIVARTCKKAAEDS